MIKVNGQYVYNTCQQGRYARIIKAGNAKKEEKVKKWCLVTLSKVKLVICVYVYFQLFSPIYLISQNTQVGPRIFIALAWVSSLIIFLPSAAIILLTEAEKSDWKEE